LTPPPPGGRLVFHVFGALASFESPVTEVAQVLGVSRATLYRRVPELADVRRQGRELAASQSEAVMTERTLSDGVVTASRQQPGPAGS